VATYPGSIFEAGPCLDATLEELNAIGLLDNASLVITPNAYNETKLYDVVPNTTLGDMDVVRATTATRVNSAGLIEVVPRNLLTQSNNFTSVGDWYIYKDAGSTFSQTSNYGISPDGTQNASRLVSSIVGGIYSDYNRYVEIIIGNTYTYSIWIKSLAGTPTIKYFINGSTRPSATLTTDWVRYTYTFTATINNCYPSIFIQSPSSSSYDILTYGAQLEQGSTATEYFPTTTRLNIPRIDYTNGSCPSILVEPQRTNLILRSQEIGTSPWAFGGILDSVTPNTIISPDGTQNADTFVCGYSGYSSVYQSATTTSGILYTFSVFAKKGNQNKLSIELRGTGTTPNIVFDLNNGTILSGSGGTIENYGNGWYRCTLTKLSNSTSTLIIIGRDTTGNIGDTFSLYGAQLEAGSYATSYIPTVATSVTRNADVISKTGISSLIGQTEGTLFFDGIVNNIQNLATNILNTNKDPLTISTFALSKIKSTNKFSFDFFLGNGTYTTINLLSTNAFANGVRTKVAIRYKSGDFAIYVNGNLEATSSSTFTANGSKSEIFLNDLVTYFSYQESVSYNSVQLYKTALTDTELAQLTTI
jgi:hypothetical protein